MKKLLVSVLLIILFFVVPFWANCYETPWIKTTGKFEGLHNLKKIGPFHYAARYYDPALGRFITPDSVMAGLDSQALNPYSYCENNPTTMVDPSGHYPTDPDSSHPYWKGKTGDGGNTGFISSRGYDRSFKTLEPDATKTTYIPKPSTYSETYLTADTRSRTEFLWDSLQTAQYERDQLFLKGLEYGLTAASIILPELLPREMVELGTASLFTDAQKILKVGSIQKFSHDGHAAMMWTSLKKPSDFQIASWANDLGAEVAVMRYMGDVPLTFENGLLTVKPREWVMTTAFDVNEVPTFYGKHMYKYAHTHLNCLKPSDHDITNLVHAYLDNGQKKSFIIPAELGGRTRIRYDYLNKPIVRFDQ